MQDNIQVIGNKITGTLHHVTGYTQFTNDTTKQSGNFLALKITADPGATVQFQLIGGDTPAKTLDMGDPRIVFRIASTSQQIKLTANKDEKETSTTYDLSGLTLESGGDV